MFRSWRAAGRCPRPDPYVLHEAAALTFHPPGSGVLPEHLSGTSRALLRNKVIRSVGCWVSDEKGPLCRGPFPSSGRSGPSPVPAPGSRNGAFCPFFCCFHCCQCPGARQGLGTRVRPPPWCKDASTAAVSPQTATTAASYAYNLAKILLGSQGRVREQAEHLSEPSLPAAAAPASESRPRSAPAAIPAVIAIQGEPWQSRGCERGWLSPRVVGKVPRERWVLGCIILPASASEPKLSSLSAVPGSVALPGQRSQWPGLGRDLEAPP